MRKIKIEILLTGAPYPYECYWGIKDENGKIFIQSEIISIRNAKKAIQSMIDAVKVGQHEIVEEPLNKTRILKQH